MTIADIKAGPGYLEAVTLTSMDEIKQDPKKSMLYIVTMDSLKRIYRYLGITAVGVTLLALIALVSEWHQMQAEYNQRQQTINKLIHGDDADGDYTTFGGTP